MYKNGNPVHWQRFGGIIDASEGIGRSHGPGKAPERGGKEGSDASSEREKKKNSSFE